MRPVEPHALRKIAFATGGFPQAIAMGRGQVLRIHHIYATFINILHLESKQAPKLLNPLILFIGFVL